MGFWQVESVRGAVQCNKCVVRTMAGRAPLCPLSWLAVGVRVRTSEGHGKVPHFLGHRSGLRGASNAMISRNRTFVTVYLAGACEKRPHTVLSLIPSLQGLEPNVLFIIIIYMLPLTYRTETACCTRAQARKAREGFTPFSRDQIIIDGGHIIGARWPGRVPGRLRGW